jgi:GNAT superfamily N-acetyltransferase
MPFVIRDATADDVPALARVHVQTFNETHRHGQSGGPSYELRERQWHDGGVPGFSGELNKIYVLARLHRHGVGRLLLCRVAHRFLQQGVTSMLLFGEATNPSNGFYEVFGAERLYSETGEFHGGYGWRDLHMLVARCGRETIR